MLARRATTWLLSVLLSAAALALLAGTAPAFADSPGVARISVLKGVVSVQRGDSSDTVAAAINAPLLPADYLTTGNDSHAEVQFDDGNMLRAGPETQVRFAQLDPTNHVVQLAAGTVELRVLHSTDANPAVQTPSVTVRPASAGAFRITVTGDGQTQVTVRSGAASIATPQSTQTLSVGKTMLVQGPSSDPRFQLTSAIAYDGFDRWNGERDRFIADEDGYRYVNDQIVGVADLYSYGRWVAVPTYGTVWAPYTSPGWAPYQDGRWVWEGPYGWTWVSYEPWGWAPFHYGRWFYANGIGWAWYPGPVYARPVWQPALVAFFTFGGSGSGFSFGFGNIGWVPLAPHEPYTPWWSPRYVNNATIINRTVNITNVTNIITIYKNAGVPGAVSSVTAADWSAGEFAVRRTAVSPGELRHVSLVKGVVPVVPTAHDLRFAARSNADVARLPRPAAAAFKAFPNPIHAVRVPFERERRAVEAATQNTRPAAAPAKVTSPASAHDPWSRFAPGGTTTPTALGEPTTVTSPGSVRTQRAASVPPHRR